jgi:adenylate cyclase
MRKRFAALLLVPLAAVAAALGLGALPGIDLLSLKSGDVLRRLLADPGHADRRIVLVEVDQASLDHFERDNIPFPWPRSLYNPLLEHCARGGRRPCSSACSSTTARPGGETDASSPARSGRTGARSGVGVLRRRRRRGPARNAAGPRGRGAAPAALRRDAVAAAARAALRRGGIGSVSLRPDADGVARRAARCAVRGRVPGAALPLAAARRRSASSRGARIGGRLVPLDDDGALLVRFHGGRRDYRHHGAAEVIASAIAASEGKAPAVPAESLRGAYVIVGYSAQGLLDLKPTPLAAAAPGFETHAAALDNLLNGDFLRAAPLAPPPGWRSRSPRSWPPPSRCCRSPEPWPRPLRRRSASPVRSR